MDKFDAQFLKMFNLPLIGRPITSLTFQMLVGAQAQQGHREQLRQVQFDHNRKGRPEYLRKTRNEVSGGQGNYFLQMYILVISLISGFLTTRKLQQQQRTDF